MRQTNPRLTLREDFSIADRSAVKAIGTSERKLGLLHTPTTMAAVDYYDSSRSNNAYHNYSNAPLPPLPRSHSPYSDHAYPSQSYGGSSGRLRDDDPYDDDNSIPLNGRRKHDSATTISPILPHQQEDPFVRDADPRKKRRRKGKDGWFTGKITYVVYVLTVIQIAVFLAEVIKNGEMLSLQGRGNMEANTGLQAS